MSIFFGKWDPDLELCPMVWTGSSQTPLNQTFIVPIFRDKINEVNDLIDHTKHISAVEV